MEFIARHLDYSFTDKPIKEYDCQCKLCGKDSNFGVSGMITDTFTDHAYFRNPESDLLCRDCAVVLGKIEHNGKKTFLRNFSFLCTEEEFRILKREEILDIILKPPKGKFILCVTYNNKKHMAFKAQIQENREWFRVTTDTGVVAVDRKKAEDIISVIQNWYSVIPEKADTKAQPTYFTKQDILTGCNNYKKMEEYGAEKYFTENQQIDRLRRSGMFKLLVFCLNKGI